MSLPLAVTSLPVSTPPVYHSTTDKYNPAVNRPKKRPSHLPPPRSPPSVSPLLYSSSSHPLSMQWQARSQGEPYSPLEVTFPGSFTVSLGVQQRPGFSLDTPASTRISPPIAVKRSHASTFSSIHSRFRPLTQKRSTMIRKSEFLLRLQSTRALSRRHVVPTTLSIN